MRGLPQRFRVLRRAFVHHDGAGPEISQPLPLFAAQHAGDAHGIKRRKLIHDPQQMARHRFDRCDRPAGFLDYADSQIAEMPRNNRNFRRYSVKVRSRIAPEQSRSNSNASKNASGSRRRPLSRTALCQESIHSENIVCVVIVALTTRPGRPSAPDRSSAHVSGGSQGWGCGAGTSRDPLWPNSDGTLDFAARLR